MGIYNKVKLNYGSVVRNGGEAVFELETLTGTVKVDMKPHAAKLAMGTYMNQRSLEYMNKEMYGGKLYKSYKKKVRGTGEEYEVRELDPFVCFDHLTDLKMAAMGSAGSRGLGIWSDGPFYVLNRASDRYTFNTDTGVIQLNNSEKPNGLQRYQFDVDLIDDAFKANTIIPNPRGINRKELDEFIGKMSATDRLTVADIMMRIGFYLVSPYSSFNPYRPGMWTLGSSETGKSTKGRVERKILTDLIILTASEATAASVCLLYTSPSPRDS